MRVLSCLCPLFLLTLFAPLESCKNDKPDGPGGYVDPEVVKKELAVYFLDYLSGEELLYTEKAELKIENIASEQELVWEAWKTANSYFPEQKLIPTSDLEQENSDIWDIPEDLEPIPELPYYWGAKGDKPVSGFPMFVYLHGSGDKDKEWKNGIALARLFDDAPSVYFVPQNPNTKDFQPWYLRGKQFALEKLLRLALLGGEVDPNKIFFIGISEGAYGSQRFASFYGDYMAGAGPMAGGEPVRNAPVENCRNLAFSLLTGENDSGFHRNRLTQYTKDDFEKLQAQYPGSFVHNIELIPDKGHSIDYTPMTPWLKQYQRNPYPKQVLWEDFDMHGRYRKGFYNLFVNERSGELGTRTYYQMNIVGNNIDLNVDNVTYETIEVDETWGMAMRFARTYEPVKGGKFTVYLCGDLVDLTKDVTLTVNGKVVFSGKVIPDRRHIVNSCAAFFDPARLYPAAIEVEL